MHSFNKPPKSFGQKFKFDNINLDVGSDGEPESANDSNDIFGHQSMNKKPQSNEDYNISKRPGSTRSQMSSGSTSKNLLKRNLLTNLISPRGAQG